MASDDGHRRGERQRQILDAAVEAFAEKGFHGARISDVARRAGVADGTIYLYFRSKEDLLLSVFEAKMEELRRGLEEALARVDDPLERLRAFARYHFRQVQEHRAVAEVLQVELRLSKKFMHDYRPEVLWNYLGEIAEIVREGQRRGQVRPEIDPFVAMWSFFGALDELGMQWVLSRRHDKVKFDLQAAADQVADLFIQGMAIPRDHQEEP